MAAARKSAPAVAPIAPPPAARVSAAPVAAAQTRPAQLGAEVRPPAGRAVAIGRDGKPIWRHAVIGGDDPYAIDPSIVPDDWVYEWKRYSIYGQIQTSYLTSLKRIGKWTEVLKESHDGMFDAPGIKGTIIHEGLILMERPWSLHKEAVDEEKNAANMALQRAKSERGLAPANSGIDVNTPAARGATFVKQERLSQEDAQALAENRPKYDYERQSID